MMMRRRVRGFKLGRKIIRVFKYFTRYSKTSYNNYHKLNTQTIQNNKTISKLRKWGRKIKHGLLNPGSTRRYIRLGHGPKPNTKPSRVPKGHLAVYVGKPDGDTWRVLVPVLFLNHPLFEKLLKESEDVYGYDHPGRITIPCPISEFENVKTRIAAARTKCRRPVSSFCPSIKCLST
ncbi:hypothetical protein RND81_08G125800 [Saponaria officinalis]|uniref:Uncharacterized protein n=1 Tax=Saponaria officinalis TaxID=3572 RepID=A0AAW1J6W6_SAPOF